MTHYHLKLLVAGWRSRRNSARNFLTSYPGAPATARAAALEVETSTDARIELAVAYLKRIEGCDVPEPHGRDVAYDERAMLLDHVT